MPQWEVRFDLRVDTANAELVRLLAHAEALASVIRRIPIPPPVRARLDALNILRAVRGTTGIEGSDLTEDEVAQVLRAKGALPARRHREREQQEVRNADAVMRYVARLLQNQPDAPLTEDLVRQVHRLTTEGIPYEHNEPGRYRSHGVTAGDYAAPRPDDVPALMEQLIAWSRNQAQELPPVVAAIAAHFYLISIHPFGDGNGRTSRAIESFMLYRARANVLGFYSLSNFYYRHRAAYVDALDATRFQPGRSLMPFVLFALGGLVEELQSIHEEVLDEMTAIAFRAFVQEYFDTADLRRPVADRRRKLVMLLDPRASLAEIRRGTHPAQALYASRSEKMFLRDLQALERAGLVVVEGDTVRPNYGLMRDYMP